MLTTIIREKTQITNIFHSPGNTYKFVVMVMNSININIMQLHAVYFYLMLPFTFWRVTEYHRIQLFSSLNLALMPTNI